MFRFLVSLIKFVFYIFMILLSYLTISDVFLGTNYYVFSFEYIQYLRFIGFLSLIYLLIFIFSLIERIFKQSKAIKSKSKNGSIEVNLDTINDLSKNFLESKNIIKIAKVNSHIYFSKVIINAGVETYNLENLNEKLSLIQQELKEYILLMTGVEVRNAAIKINKILQESVIYTTELEDKTLDALTDEEIVSSTDEF